MPDILHITPQARGEQAGRKKGCTIALDVEPDRIERAELHVAIWDGGKGTVADYFTLNRRPLPVAADGRHRVIYSVLKHDRTLLRRGQNRIELLSDTEHHGLEVLLPGPALVVRTKPKDSATKEHPRDLESRRPHDAPTCAELHVGHPT